MMTSRPRAKTNDLPATFGIGGHGDYRRDRNDPTSLALLEKGGVQPDIGPFPGERAVQKFTDPLIDILAELGKPASIPTTDRACSAACQPDGTSSQFTRTRLAVSASRSTLAPRVLNPMGEQHAGWKHRRIAPQHRGFGIHQQRPRPRGAYAGAGGKWRHDHRQYRAGMLGTDDHPAPARRA